MMIPFLSLFEVALEKGDDLFQVLKELRWSNRVEHRKAAGTLPAALVQDGFEGIMHILDLAV